MAFYMKVVDVFGINDKEHISRISNFMKRKLIVFASMGLMDLNTHDIGALVSILKDLGQ